MKKDDVAVFFRVLPPENSDDSGVLEGLFLMR